MGFTKTVAKEAPESYKPYYLKYDDLKELVLELAREEPFNRRRLMSADILEMANQPIGKFQDILRAELKKVNQFACVKHEDVFLGLRRLCEQCKRLSPEEVQPMAKRIRILGEEIVHLDTYVRLNYMGFQMLTEKFDACLGTSGSPLFVSGLHCEPFCNIRFDDILILLGLAWARWRSAQAPAEQSKDATWKPPESFIRNTSKYWVQPDKVVLLKTRIVEHLPYLIFGASQSEQEKLLEPFALLDLEYRDSMDSHAVSAYSGTLEESQLLSSVYFDSPDGTSYQERIRREEGARLVRFRWYGENSQEDDKEIYIERKIHHEGWGGAKSAKERCVLPQEDVFDFMKGKFNIEAYFAKLAANGTKEKTIKGMKPIAIEVNKMIQEKKLQPIIRTSYYRCAFQLATDNKVRISLDTQMSLLNEYVQNGHPNKPWCLVGTDTLHREDIYRFPYAILEIKLQDVSEAPLWLRQTLNDIGAIQVHKFSKFQHAMAFLHPQRCPILPHWHKDFEEWHKAKDEKKLRLGKGNVSAMMRSEATFDDLAVPKVSKVVAPQGEGHFLKDMENLDPKAVFANERTLLHYAEKGMYVGAVAVVVLHQGGRYKILGGGLLVLTAVYYIWILVAYFQRLDEIKGRSKVVKNREARLDWNLGPILATIMVSVVLAYTLSKGWLGLLHSE